MIRSAKVPPIPPFCCQITYSLSAKAVGYEVARGKKDQEKGQCCYHVVIYETLTGPIDNLVVVQSSLPVADEYKD
jgi:hypothetical protein